MWGAERAGEGRCSRLLARPAGSHGRGGASPPEWRGALPPAVEPMGSPRAPSRLHAEVLLWCNPRGTSRHRAPAGEVDPLS